MTNSKCLVGVAKVIAEILKYETARLKCRRRQKHVLIDARAFKVSSLNLVLIEISMAINKPTWFSSPLFVFLSFNDSTVT